jgi:hypothetical protein
MSLRIEEMLLESDLDLAELGDVVDLLAPLGELSETSPLPSAELEELFTASPPVAPVTALLGRRRGAVAGALVLAISGVGATGLSAAANTLPRPWQHGVSQFSQRYLPFDLPEPPKRAKSPLGIDTVPPAYPSIAVGRASGEPTSRSIPGRDPAVGAYPKGRPAQQPVDRPSASPSYSTFAVGPSAQPSPSGSPSGSPSPSEGSAGRPASSPSAHPSDQKPGKGSGKGGHDGKGQNHGPGPSDPGTQGEPGSAPLPGGEDPAPTSPAPDVPVPTLPLPDPLPDLGPIVGIGTVGPGADAG